MFIWLLLPVSAGSFGYFAYTTNPLLIGFAVAIVLGLGLLQRPNWIVTLVLLLGIIVGGLLPLFLESLAGKALWGIAILGFVLLGFSLVKIITEPLLAAKTPAFVWLALFFIAYTLIESVIQVHSLMELISGFKRYFQVWGILFAFCWLKCGTDQIVRWQKLILIAAFLQLPLCLYQLIWLVPIRERFVDAMPELVPIDIVAGTFGGDLLGGGGSAEMSTFLIIIFCFLLARYKENLLPLDKFLQMALLVLLPLFLGEAKIIVIFFLLACCLVYRHELLVRPTYLIVALLLGGIFLIVIANVLVIITHMSLDQLIFDTLKYNVYGTGYGTFYLNRTTVLTFWAEHQHWGDPTSFVFGNGLGAAKSTTKPDVSLPGFLNERYPNYGIGLTGVSTLLWEIGIFGFGLLLTLITFAWRCANRLQRSNNPVVRADANAIQVGLALFTLFLFYLNTPLEMVSLQIVFITNLGYLAWLHRQHSTDVKRNLS